MFIAKQTIRVRGARKELIGKGNTVDQALQELSRERLNAVENNSYRPGNITVEEE